MTVLYWNAVSGLCICARNGEGCILHVGLVESENCGTLREAWCPVQEGSEICWNSSWSGIAKPIEAQMKKFLQSLEASSRPQT